MRGTLHVLPASELPLVVAALRAGAAWRSAQSWKILEIGPDDAEAIGAAIRAALDGQALTREALADAVVRQTGQERLREKILSGWGSLLKPAAYAGDLCFGPSAGQNVTFVRPDQWLGGWQAFDPHQALREMVRRYLRAYGPAVSGDFATWWGMGPKAARPLFQSLGAELQEVKIDEKRVWALAETVPAIQAQALPEGVRLLPSFDPYVVVAAARYRPRIIPPAFRDRVTREGAWLSPVVLVDGATAGVWESARQRAGLVVRVEELSPFSPAVKRGVEAEARRLAGFLEAPAVEIRYDGVSF